MFLKRLELTGFKSFAEKLGIDFVPGVTAVVGPNGSGKSNISDAIRWVLGEQSARNLRGGKMEDVIFSGSDKRKALNMAEISLVLDNEDQHVPIDYSEVVVTRRLYRSGESEYLLNKQTCRLKDITDLFMDSGLGKEAFSIIGQGRVEEILSSKSEERRMIFEEAAGVLKYKFRKQASEKKLADTEDNLSRVRDIIHELEQQTGPLEEQASVAKEYLSMKAELNELEAGVTVKEIQELHAQWTNLKNDYDQVEDQKRQHEIDRDRLEQTVLTGREALQELDDELSEQQQQLLIATEELEKAEGKKQLFEERLRNFDERRAQHEQEMTQLRDQLKKTESELMDVVSNKKEQTEQVKQLEDELKELEVALFTLSESSEEQLEELKSEYMEWMNARATDENNLQNQIASKNRLLGRIEQKRAQLRELDQESREALTEKESLKDAFDHAAAETEKCLSLYREKENEEGEKRQSLTDNEQQFREIEKEHQRKRSRRDVLKDMEEDYAGFFHGVKDILKQRDGNFHGLIGAVAEVISFNERYKTAVETALGGALQHVITDTADDARSAINYLKTNRKGRATFLPLDTIKPKSISDYDLGQIGQIDGVIGQASRLIDTEPRLRPVIEHQLGNVVFTENLKQAQQAAKILKHRYRIVTLDGDVVSPGGAMTGGSLQQKSGQILSRKSELKTLESEVSSLEANMQEQERFCNGLRTDLAVITQKKEKLKHEGERLRKEERQLESRYQEQSWLYQSYADKQEVAELELSEAVAEYEDADREQERLSLEIEKANERISELDQAIQELSESLKDKQVQEKTYQDKRNDLKIELASARENLRFTGETEARLTGEADDVKRSMDQRMSELKKQEDVLNQGTKESAAEELEQWRQNKQTATAYIKDLRTKRFDKESGLEAKEGELKGLNQQVQYLSRTAQELEVKINRLDVNLDTKLTTLQEQFEITFERAEKRYHLEIPLQKAKEKVKLMRMGIEELGHVNTGAIEEFERVKERYGFLSEQKQDLEDAKGTLHEVINEMDQEMIRRFDDTFTQIQSCFQDVFKQLFGGGRAALELTDPDDLLHTGVDIVAQPPGKKLQHLALLSGGERALTAIALLFSILQVRPVPFCVLDEVEAALDEANVVRFANYLKDFSEDTQFIVVTHRKGTMEEADVLYGVTMEESGVSNLVSVKLEESEQFAGAEK
ncbi:chromosome segregation protein SMC [Salisediminibacterium selenitireducens]|uniref:Chromosome partition protein Smc n=1 Tax=Bacillus selenitireducens (strain ATCC 700615 / DSM 15326 / MLS10) TaxID=439292 RepID=D6XTT7_BACIE|nr:chromosome segregation protein SMC [Salisediminibacterium selenitireducens]ADH99223.1 chromosome segregation protein SMC [[Bacillus] selenitireducens MLS10]